MSATRTSLRHDLVTLGIQPGDTLMVHAGVRSFGPVIGGVNTIIQALQDAITPTGTLVAYVDWEPFHEEEDPDPPIFDKRIARAARDHGILHEALRTWPGAIRSDHPDAGVAAVGAKAAWITANHPLQYGYGEGSPLEKVVEANGKVLMMGCSLDTITLLHYAEHKARIPGKRLMRYRRRMPGDIWIDIEEFDTTEPVSGQLPANCFEQIGEAYLAAGHGRDGRIAQARAALFDAPGLVTFAIHWLERHTMPA
jgi:aminoglycoside 3-N-acetyltransferase